MATTIDQSYIDTFEQNLRHLAQQEETRLRHTVTERGAGSENHNWERLASAEATQKTHTVVTATPDGDRAWSRRVSVANTWHDGEVTQQEDPSMMLVDPNSNLVTSLAYSMRRAMDGIIVRAANENSLDGDGNPVAYNAAQTIGTGAESISFDLITQVQENFMNNNIYPEVPKVAVIGPKQMRQLMNLTEMTSSDYVQAQALQAYGIVPNWLGFTWICSTLLNTSLTTPLTDEIYCLFYTKRALGLHVPMDVMARVAEDPGNSFAWRIYCQFTAGATRVEDEHLVRLHLEDA
jgi:hypothetical protein